MQRRKILFAGVGLMSAIACDSRNSQSSEDSNLLSVHPPHSGANGLHQVSAAEYLKMLPAPKYARGHTLPLLSRFGWTLPFATRVELAERWGYALEWGPYASPDNLKRLTVPNSDEAKVMRLFATRSPKYQLAVILNRDLPDTPEVWLRDERGELIDGKKNWSPEAPISALKAAARMRAEPLLKIREQAPISIVLNGGEYGLGVLGHVRSLCARDPRVVAARGNRDWFEYISERKAYQESFIAKAVREIVPHRQAYVYYPADSNPHRDRYWGWKEWCYDYKYMRKITDYPSSSTYFQEFNTGWTGSMDMLTQVLNSIGQQIKFGQPLSYNWVCSGWLRDGKNPVFGEIDRYLGFLKCYYAAGMLGGIAGYFNLPKGGFEASFHADSPPNWLLQIVALSRVHALFSHLEDYLRHGDLLPGPMKHIWSKDTPAYEFPTSDPDVRVVARKHRRKSTWLIAVWAAAGKSRRIDVTIPQLERLSLVARPQGSIYTAQIRANKVKLVWVDRSIT